MDKIRLNKKGLSLVEVVMAALLLTVVLAALFASYRNANNLMSLSRSKLLALTWAQSLIENERADFRGTYVSPIDTTQEALVLEKPPASANVAVGSLGGTMQSIKVTITWTE